MKYTISPSQLRSMNCRQRWYWAYQMGYRQIMSNINLEFGTGIHAALEHYYTPNPMEEDRDMITYFKNWIDLRIEGIQKKSEGNILDEEIEKFNDLKGLGVAMLEGYLERWNGKDEFDVIATEKTLRRRLPIPGRDGGMSMCDVVVRLDGIVRCHTTGKLFSLEHKTFTRFAPAELEVDQQFTAQAWVGEVYAQECGLSEPVVGVIYNGLRKQRPGPRVKVPLFERHKVYRNQHEIDSFLHRAYWSYRDCRKWQIYVQPSSLECAICDFRIPCGEKLRGGDYQFILDNNYTKRGEKK